jgi:hypothetical protein
MDGSVYPSKDVIVASKTCVNIFCNDETKHEPKKKYGNEEWCEANYGQICDEHVKNHNATSGLFFKDSIPNPTSILCMPDGTEIKRKVGAATNKELIDMMKEAMAKVGAGLGQDEYLLGKGKLKACDEAVKAGKMKDAIEALNASNKSLGKNPAAKSINDAVKAKLEELNKAGLDIIEKAKADAAAGKVDEARKAMKDVYANYKGLECAKSAEKELAALPKDK